MDEVARTGETILITKHGKPVAQLTPPPGRPRADVFGLHRGLVVPIGAPDLDEPVLEAAAWSADEANSLGRK